MPRNSRAWRNASALLVALVLTCSCAGGGQGSSAVVKPAARTTPAADAYSCASVQALLGHLAVGTSHWSPKDRPFDRTVAAEIRSTSLSLQKQLPRVRTVVVLRAVSSSAKAFSDVATAMTLKQRARVARAITATQVAYHRLKKACGPA